LCDDMEEEEEEEEPPGTLFNAKSPPSPLPRPRSKARTKRLPRIHPPESAWDMRVTAGMQLKRTDFKRSSNNAQLHLKLPPSEALGFIQRVFEGGELSIVGGIAISEVTLHESGELLQVVGGCDGVACDGAVEQAVEDGSSVTLHVQAQESNDPDHSILTFYRFHGALLSYRTILLAIRTNLEVQLNCV